MKARKHEKSMSADPDEVEGDPDIVKDMTSGYVSPPAAASRMNSPSTPPPSPPMAKSGFMSVSLSKAHGSPCPSKPKYVDSGPEWEEGKSSKEEPVEEDGQYLPPSMKMVKEDGEDKVVKKSLTELRYGSQLSRTYDIGKSCGMCGKISKSVGEEGHEGHSGCCSDCRKSMNSVRWHDSHLA